jgi:hypothetical protein
MKKMLEHYKEKKNYGELYHEAGATSTKHVPNIFAILLSTVRLFNLRKKGKMPLECLNLLMSHINNPNITDDKDEWNLIRDWLITATYCDGKKKKKSSVVRIDTEGVTCNDHEVRECISQCLDETIGPRRKPAPRAIPPPPMVQHTAFCHRICPPRVLASPWISDEPLA